MNLFPRTGVVIAAVACLATAGPLTAQTAKPAPAAASAQKVALVTVTGTVRDQANAIALPGVPVEVEGLSEIAYTDVDGRFVLKVPAGTYNVKVALDGYETRVLSLNTTDSKTPTLDVGLSMAKFAETVVVTGRAVDIETSSAEAQLTARMQAPVISDNLGSQQMLQNGDRNAAAAMTRVTGISIVDNQYVFVRGLGERYSNTQMGGSTLPTTEPDKKVVPLDLFPTGLVDSVQVHKSYSPDRSAEFAGGLVQIMPMKLPVRPMLDFSYGASHISTATGKSLPLSPLGSRDVWGFDSGARALPASIPNRKIVRSGIYTPDVGFSPAQATAFGQALNSGIGGQWRPENQSGAPGQNWSVTFGRRLNKLGVVASMTHSYAETFVAEDRRFFRIADEGDLEAVSDYKMQTGTQRAQMGIVGNLSYQFAPTQRISVENFFTHSGRDEGRTFQGINLDNAREYRNTRLQFIEEGLLTNAVSGEHFFQSLSNSRIDWRLNVARARRDEPGLREALYERLLNRPNDPFLYADESQSGFQMFNTLDDDTMDGQVNWSISRVGGSKPTVYKFGTMYVDRSRDFRSRRFHFIPITATKDGALSFNPQSDPETLFTSANIGTAFRFNEETRPTDAYAGVQTTTSGYGMADITLGGRSRLIAGARVERFNQEVTTQDPFGLFARSITAENRNTDVFPGINFVQGLGASTNLRLSYSTTVNRPEFRELAEFEFTDVVGNRAVRGNRNLKRALVQNVDARWEMFGTGRNIVAASTFFKYFDQPIERVIIAAANPIATFQNSDSARNFGIELEAGHTIGKNLFFNANYTFVDSQITLLPEQRSVQTSLKRPLAGQSRNLFNMSSEYVVRGFSARVLYNYSGDRISDVGAFQAPDILEQGRGILDLAFAQRVKAINLRVTINNVTDADYRFTQTLDTTETQRLFNLGRTVAFSATFSAF
jgi:hypothetical protein